MALDQAAEVVAEHFTERFVRHGGIGLRPDVVAELRLDHGVRVYGAGVRPRGTHALAVLHKS